MAQVTNFTDYFREERDVYVQNLSGCNVSVTFETSPGRAESYLFVPSKDPVNLSRHIPFNAIKSSMDLRKMINRVPLTLKLLDETEFGEYYNKKAVVLGLESASQAMDKAEQERTLVQQHVLPDTKPEPQEKKIATSSFTSEEEVINAKVLNLCLQVHPSLPDTEKMTAQVFLSELSVFEDHLTQDDWAYIQSWGFYKSIKNYAAKKVVEFAAAASGGDDEETPAESTTAPKKKKK